MKKSGQDGRSLALRCGLLIAICVFSLSGKIALAGTNLTPARLGYSAVTFTILPILVGQDRGIFEASGIDLRLQQIRGDLAIPSLLNNELDYAIGVLPTVWAAAEGLPIRQIAGGQIKPAFSLIAQPSITGFADLKGKLIGVSRLRSLASNLLQAILKRHGLSFADVKVLSLQTTNNVYITLDTKQIAAGMLSVPLDIKAKLAGYKQLARASDYATAYQGGIATSVKKLSEMADVTEKFLSAYVRSLRAVKSDRAATVAVIAKTFKVDSKLAQASYDEAAGLFQDAPIIPVDVIDAEIRTWSEMTGKRPSVPAEGTMEMRPLQKVLQRLETTEKSR